jgi:hypothetical protein
MRVPMNLTYTSYRLRLPFSVERGRFLARERVGTIMRWHARPLIDQGERVHSRCFVV